MSIRPTARSLRRLYAVASILLSTAMLLPSAGIVGAGENWPQFRGPSGDGHSDAVDLPLAWSAATNVVWKTPIHDRGWSSPVIWNEQIWLTTATADGRRSFAVCVDRASGRVIHDVPLFDTANPDHIAEMNSYASPTGGIEPGRFYAHFGTYGTVCVDTASGKVLWSRHDLKCDHHEGPGASAMLWNDLLIFHVDGRDVQYVVALDKATGKTVWKTNRSVDYSPFHMNLRKSFCTPIVVQLNGRPQLISPGAKAMMGYDPRTGEELWKLRYNGWSITPRPLFADGTIYLINDYERPELWAVRPQGAGSQGGELPASVVQWKINRAMPSRPSLLLVGELLFMVNSDGVASCIEAKTGAKVWQERLGGNYSASPIYADGRLWFFNQDAVTTVLRPERRFEILAVNRLGSETLMATPAVAGSAWFIRTEKFLYRIEKREPTR